MAAMNQERSQFDDWPALMSPKTLAKLLEVSTKTLERWRTPPRTGPDFVQPSGSSLVRYTRDDVVSWLNESRRRAPET
jgi:predicted site-specific integrase-resolvase